MSYDYQFDIDSYLDMVNLVITKQHTIPNVLVQIIIEYLREFNNLGFVSFFSNFFSKQVSFIQYRGSDHKFLYFLVSFLDYSSICYKFSLEGLSLSVNENYGRFNSDCIKFVMKYNEDSYVLNESIIAFMFLLIKFDKEYKAYEEFRIGENEKTELLWKWNLYSSCSVSILTFNNLIYISNNQAGKIIIFDSQKQCIADIITLVKPQGLFVVNNELLVTSGNEIHFYNRDNKYVRTLVLDSAITQYAKTIYCFNNTIYVLDKRKKYLSVGICDINTGHLLREIEDVTIKITYWSCFFENCDICYFLGKNELFEVKHYFELPSS